MQDSTLSREKYWDTINTMADQIEEYCEEYPEDDDVHSHVVEEVDSCKYIIYTGYHTDVIDLGDSEPTEWHHFIDPDKMDNYREVLQTMAYEVMRQDLNNELSDRGVL